MLTWSVTQAAICRLCFWEAIVPKTHRALQIYLLSFFKAYTSVGSRIVTCWLLTTVIKCLQLKSPRTRPSALFWAYTSTRYLAGFDGITPAILKRLASVVLWISFLTCHCLLVFFLQFGGSLLLFLYSKSGDKRDMSCYHGISILLANPKLFENNFRHLSCHIWRATWFCDGPLNCQ
jgi:hypothetical protein